MTKIDWEQDWNNVPVSQLAEAISILANSLGGIEQDVLDAAAEELWRLSDLEK